MDERLFNTDKNNNNTNKSKLVSDKGRSDKGKSPLPTSFAWCALTVLLKLN